MELMEATYERGRNISDPDQVESIYQGVVGKKCDINSLMVKANTGFTHQS
jgi:hypothetical protein